MYIISDIDETKFITLDKNQKFTWTTNKDGATRYKTKIKANNIISSNLTLDKSEYKVCSVSTINTMFTSVQCRNPARHLF